MEGERQGGRVNTKRTGGSKANGVEEGNRAKGKPDDSTGRRADKRDEERDTKRQRVAGEPDPGGPGDQPPADARPKSIENP